MLIRSTSILTIFNIRKILKNIFNFFKVEFYVKIIKQYNNNINNKQMYII